MFLLALCGGELFPADDVAKFVDDVQPLLIGKCVSCHGPEKQEGGLRLDSLAAARDGGEQGPAIVPGDVAKSLLVKAISFRDPNLQMPPKQKLSEKEIATLTEWVKAGARWPEPVVVLFEDEPQFLSVLTSGNGKGRLVTENTYSGKAALGMTPLQRDNPKVPNWSFPIREKPGAGEFRYLRLAWKKRGEGSVMLEIAQNGNWPDAKVAKGRYFAGPNTTGWAAISVGEKAPSEWKVETFDLWKDIGEFSFTGCAPTCDRGEEAFFDAMILGPTIESLDAYRAGSSSSIMPGKTAPPSNDNVGDAFTDRRNPVRKAFGGERLDLWSLKGPVSSGKSIDELVLAALAKEKSELAPEADSRTLIRRLSFDLLGLPPTPEEVANFERESRADRSAAYRKLVDRLLASPHYGERQARLWLDVVRYADTNGYERDEFRPLIYQYRDYVIRSFNQDKPFDQFVREQLAGDELLLSKAKGSTIRTADEDLLLATGFLRLGQWDSTASIFQEEPRLRAEMMADLTNTTASAFLGMTFSCCQCHDHKYDPLTQADHFRLRAFFAAVQDKNDTVVSSPNELAEIKRHNAALDAQAEPLKKEQAAMLDASRERVSNERRGKLTEDVRKSLETDPAKWDDATKKKLQPVLDQLKVNDKDARAALDEAAKQRDGELTQQITAFHSKKREPRKGMTAQDSGRNAPETRIFYQGDFASPRDAVEPGFPSVFAPAAAVVSPPAENTTGRRLALANWIASEKNPWTARVIVNRIWQQHFGTGLVATPNDFGFSGARPTHQELLDTLAVEFMRRGWSIKDLHRTIVTSATYRQKSGIGFQPVTAAKVELPKHDRQDAYPTAFTPTVRRLDAETLRDALLAVSGLLKPYDSGKPLWPPVAEELLKAQPAILEAEKGGDGGRMQGWYANPIEETDVRSVFLVRKRCLPIPFLQAFDLPDTTVSCARRDTTVVAPQALMLLNSDEGVRYAKSVADRLTATTPLDFDDAERTRKLIDSLFQRALVRSPTSDERSLAVEFLRRHRAEHAKTSSSAPAAHRAFVDLCRAILNLNEFAYID
jgi:cytochrome c551/c552